jgi:hypothetical protein
MEHEFSVPCSLEPATELAVGHVNPFHIISLKFFMIFVNIKKYKRVQIFGNVFKVAASLYSENAFYFQFRIFYLPLHI